MKSIEHTLIRYALIIIFINDLDNTNNSLSNENNETFNFGIKDGVRGFFTDPSRADDCFIPFKSNSNMHMLELVHYEAPTGTYDYRYNIELSGVYIIGFITYNFANFTMTTDANILHEVDTVGTSSRKCVIKIINANVGDTVQYNSVSESGICNQLFALKLNEKFDNFYTVSSQIANNGDKTFTENVKSGKTYFYCALVGGSTRAIIGSKITNSYESDALYEEHYSSDGTFLFGFIKNASNGVISAICSSNYSGVSSLTVLEV